MNLQYLEATQLMPDGGIEPSIDAVLWSMDGNYPFAWTPGSQKVIILMTDEQAQTTTSQNTALVNAYATDQGFEIFVFALQEHHNSFLAMVRGSKTGYTRLSLMLKQCFNRLDKYLTIFVFRVNRLILGITKESSSDNKSKSYADDRIEKKGTNNTNRLLVHD